MAERQVEMLKEQVEELRHASDGRAADSSNHLDQALDQLKKSNIEMELATKEKEVGLHSE